MSPALSLSVIVSIFLSALKHTRTLLFNAKVAKGSDAKVAKALRVLCVPSALFALRHTRTTSFQRKVRKGF